MVNEAADLDALIALYETYCKAKGLAPRTIDTYIDSVRRLRGYLSGESESPAIPSHLELRTFIAHMLDRGLSRQTIRVRMRAIRAFMNFLVREELLERSPMQRVEIPRVPHAIPTVLTDAQMAAMIRAANNTRRWHGKRNHAIVLTFLDTGIRLSELVNLHLADVDLRNSTLHIRDGKGGKDRTVYFGRSLHRSLRRWLDARGVSGSCPSLFLTNRDTPMDRSAIARIVKTTAAKAGLGHLRVHPHALRHSFATAFIRNGGDVFSLQSILGHTSVKVTEIYVTMAGVDLRNAHAKASPVDRLH